MGNYLNRLIQDFDQGKIESKFLKKLLEDIVKGEQSGMLRKSKREDFT